MSMPIHVRIKGKKQGEIKGSCTMKGREGTILVQALQHEVSIPTDEKSGMPTGKRLHLPLTITKEIDKSSPMLYSALCSGEDLSEVELDFYRIKQTGSEEKYFTIKITDATIVDIKSWFNCQAPDSRNIGHMEDVSFHYASIRWTWEPDGIEAEDSWYSPL